MYSVTLGKVRLAGVRLSKVGLGTASLELGRVRWDS